MILRRRILEAIGILIITTVMLEIGLRIYGRYATVSEKSNGEYYSFYQSPASSWYLYQSDSLPIVNATKEFTYTYPKNSAGFFTKEIEPKQPDRKRIFILGDSFTEGIGAPPDSSWPVLLETILRAQRDSNMEVFNLGLSGSDPFYCYRLLADKLLDYHPDEVIFSINRTDIFDYIGRGGMERFGADGKTYFRPAPWPAFLYRHSHIVRGFFTGVMKSDQTLLSPAREEHLIQEAVVRIVDVLAQAKTICDHRGIKMLVVVHPLMEDVVPIHRDQRDRFRIFEIIPGLEQQGIECLDTRLAFAAMTANEDPEDYGWKVDGHFKSRGYALYARIVFDSKFKSHR